MTLDLSMEAIEADLAMAERGGPMMAVALARAQVRATLIAAGLAAPSTDGGQWSGMEQAVQAPTVTVSPHVGPPSGTPDINVEQGPAFDVYTVPKAASWGDRLEAAAMLLGMEEAVLHGVLGPEPDFTVELGGVHFTRAQWEAVQVYAGGSDAETATVEEPPKDDMDDDFFAEARNARRKK